MTYWAEDFWVWLEHLDHVPEAMEIHVLCCRCRDAARVMIPNAGLSALLAVLMPPRVRCNRAIYCRALHATVVQAFVGRCHVCETIIVLRCPTQYGVSPPMIGYSDDLK